MCEEIVIPCVQYIGVPETWQHAETELQAHQWSTYQNVALHKQSSSDILRKLRCGFWLMIYNRQDHSYTHCAPKAGNTTALS